MTKNPYKNTVLALGYICIISMVMFYGPGKVGPIPGVLAPIVMLSLLVLSASVMGMIFFYQPVRMYLDGNKSDAVSLLVRTIVSFACVTIVLVAIALIII